MTTIKDDRQRAIADLVAEQLAHGATAEEIAALVKLVSEARPTKFQTMKGRTIQQGDETNDLPESG